MLAPTQRHRRILRAVVAVQLVETNRARMRLRRVDDADKPGDLLAARVDADDAAFDDHVHAHAGGQAGVAGQEDFVVLAAQRTVQEVRHGPVARLAPHAAPATPFAAIAQVRRDGVDAGPS